MNEVLKTFLKKLKDRGYDVGEDVAKGIVEDVFDFVEEAAAKSENKYDDLLVGLLKPLKPHVMKILDKIDGKVDEPSVDS